MTVKKICIVSCTSHKRATPMRAENLYSSELFYRSRRYAQAYYDGWYILSAKHGLLPPYQVVAPYDRKLTTLASEERRSLAGIVAKQARAFFNVPVSITSICGEEYDELLREAGVDFQRNPEFALPIGKKLKALGEVTDPQKIQRTLDQVYKISHKLSNKRPLRRLRHVIDDDMPSSGVYLFFDESEQRLKDLNQLRIVRVGTHGVAMGSKASLRNRMRTHLGTVAGEGNHRSSVFRLHVGRSLINAKAVTESLSWGLATVGKEALRAERDLEQAVSKYLENLLVQLISIPGESDKKNDRAYIEQNLIALLANGCCPLDPPSCEWLGLNSAKPEIRKAGLWNVNHVDQSIDEQFIEILDYYASLTIGSKAVPLKPLAPPDWLARSRANTKQLALF